MKKKVIISFLLLALVGFWYLKKTSVVSQNKVKQPKKQSLVVNKVKLKDYPFNPNIGNYSRKPSIIFILLDAARADHFSCYGYKRDITPNIDAIAKKGAVFLNNFSQGTHTMQCIPKIMTSRYYSEKGLATYPDTRWRFRFVTNPEDSIYLPEILEQNGYLNLAFSTHPWVNEDSDFVKKFHWLYEFKANDKPYAEADQVVPSALSWLEKNKEKKFFLYLHLMDTHSPHEVLPPYDKYINKNYNARLKFKRGNVIDEDKFFSKVTKGDIEHLNAIYDGDLNFVDHYVGLLYKKLERLGINNSTLFIVTSDHGDLLGEHNKLRHQVEDFAMEELNHVPLVMVLPGKIPPGLRIDSITESIDIMPTIMNLTEITLPEGKKVDGESLSGFFSGKKKDGEGEALMVAARDWGFARAIRTKDFKFVIDGNRYLYDMKNGSGQTNIINSNIAAAQELEKKINRKLGNGEDEWKSFIRNLNPNLSFTEKIVKGIKTASLSGWKIKKEHVKYLSKGTDAQPLGIRIQVPNDTYKVYLDGKFSKKKFFNFKNSLFKIRAENDKNYKIYNYDNIVNKKLILIGEYKISDGFFDMSIDDLKESPKFKLKNLIFKPAGAIKEHEDKERTEKLKALGYIN